MDPHPIYSVALKAHKLIVNTGFPNRPMLYNHIADPKEAKNLAQEEPDRVEELRALIDAHLADDEGKLDVPEVELDEMRLNQLRALGYAIGGPGK